METQVEDTLVSLNSYNNNVILFVIEGLQSDNSAMLVIKISECWNNIHKYM